MKHELGDYEKFVERQKRRENAREDPSPNAQEKRQTFGLKDLPHKLWRAPSRIWTFFKPSRALPYRSRTYETFLVLRGQPILAAKELLYTYCQLQVDNVTNAEGSYRDRTAPFTNSGYWTRLSRLFSAPYSRQTTAAFIVMLFQQLCGINVFIFYSATLYCQTNDTNLSSSLGPLMLSFGIGLTNFLFALPAYS